MIQAREKVIDYCTVLSEKARDAVISGDTAENITAISNSAREQQLVVPIVGAFSSGKSTLINNLLGESILPVGITPETSLATELHFSPENYILAVKENGESDRYKIEEIGTVTANAAKYRYAQLYLNNNGLRELEPLILVDMPGFDSPLDLHNKAIMEYLDRGCHYIVLSSVEEGTITRSLERRLREIEGFGRDFSFFLSKANLRPQNVVDELIAYYQNQLNDKFESKTTVTALRETADEVMRYLRGIDSNTVFLKMYRDTLLSVCDAIITNINLQINASKKDAEKLKTAITEMENSKEKLKKKMDSDIEDMRRRYSVTLVNDIIADVSNSLDRSLDELVGIAIAGNQDAFSRTINEIVRSALTVSIRDKLNGINKQIAIDFSESLQNLDRIMKDLNLDEDFLKNIAEKVELSLKMIEQLVTYGPVVNATNGLNSNIGTRLAIGAALAAKPLATIGSKAVGGTLAAVTGPTVIGPIIGIVIMFIPEIIAGLSKLFGGDPKEKQKEAIRLKFLGEVFPSIKRKLREEIPAVLGDNITTMIETVKEQFEVQIKNQEEAINAQMANEKTSIEEKEEAQQKLETIRSDVQTITSEIMAWGK